MAPEAEQEAETRDLAEQPPLRHLLDSEVELFVADEIHGGRRAQTAGRVDRHSRAHHANL